MSIATYSDLQTAVGNWLNRTDLAAQIPNFIALAESKINSDIQAREMEASTTLSTTGGVSTVALPADLLEMRRLQVISDYNTVLEYLSPDQIAQQYPMNDTGLPLTFTVIGGNVELAPIPDGVYSLQLTYRQRIPALSNSNPTNWVLTKWPNVYLYGALVAAQPYLINDARLPVFQTLYQEAVNGVNGIDWYTGSTMRVRPR